MPLSSVFSVHTLHVTGVMKQRSSDRCAESHWSLLPTYKHFTRWLPYPVHYGPDDGWKLLNHMIIRTSTLFVRNGCYMDMKFHSPCPCYKRC